MYMSRVPTIYSLSQLDAGGEDAEVPCLCKAAVTRSSEAKVADIRGTCVPTLLYSPKRPYDGRRRVRSFGELSAAAVPDMDAAAVPDMDFGSGFMSSDDDSSAVSQLSDDLRDVMLVPQKSAASTVLLAEWEDRFEAGLFRYDVTACPTKTVPGAYGFIAQLNEGRATKKRPTEITIDRVDQPFDGAKFNFTKAQQREVLFAFRPTSATCSARLKGTPGPDSSTNGNSDVVPAGGQYVTACATGSPTLVFINVSPIEYGHVLLVPRALDGLNQVVDPASMQLALQFASEVDDPFFRIGYNSLGAYGTVNHLHFQAYWLHAPYPLERAPCCPLPKGLPSCYRDVRIGQLAPGGYPVRALVFEAGESLAALALTVGRACQALVAANVPHNLMVADRGARVFLVPNAFSERKARGEVPEEVLDSQVGPATFEISGHMVLKRASDYELIDQDWCWRLLGYASYGDRFDQVAAIALCGMEE